MDGKPSTKIYSLHPQILIIVVSFPDRVWNISATNSILETG
jgi:hypothetical protein